ncbi:circularly permuted type 2 ATP-grasp protein [Nocardioides sp. Kera G14]|uniref:circularly permuted type 2 ATP-grasp protein n=1 Tax=Nocardioides sp. Kera G14 TaxID=2884264 RepID=UPI001D0FC8A0|nr:circularly permuted type 2 ATP-grasp protein [Nocardioides sp. Kera G14]UDY23260.1 circularly permuted type 2 ATP-grasp protein [Nocardioides sp. Kera G14]
MTIFRDYAASVAQPMLGTGEASARFDEVIAPDGSLRPAWKGMAEVAVSITEADLQRVSGDIARFLADDGVSYARPGEGVGPWRLDPMPLVIDAAQWQPLEVGLAQRAELLNAILIDLYGDQRLLSEGIVPAPVVFGHPGFNRVVAGLGPHRADPRPLVLAATDLGRNADGEWLVLGDRAQAPSGIGYAMENRRVISRVLPELYREAGLHRMEPYFWALRSALIQSAQGDRSDPRVVVLSPGTHSETAYDQAFLASTLGFPLVQGGDLTVKDGWVYLRTPGGRLEKVDVILRRVDASWSDPLELRGDSQLGVAGLVEAVRRGRVRVVNGFGAGVLENPGLLPYLPAASEALLGESLRLPSVPTWWAGTADGLVAILDSIGHDNFMVRTLDGPAQSLAGLSRDELHTRVQAEPWRYVGQQLPLLSQAPTWSTTGAIARPVTLRTFTLRYGSAYRPLVGGLASVRDAAPLSKDVWVLKQTPGEPDQGLSDVLPMTHARSTTVLVPRALEDMFWSGRYSERAEDLLRLILATHVIAEDYRTRPRSTGGAALGVMLTVIARLSPWAPPGTDELDRLDEDFRSLLLDEHRGGSVAQSIEGMREAFAGVRDQLSSDMWRIFGSTDRAAGELRDNPWSHQIEESAGRMLTGILAMQGVTASMIRDAGWHSIRTGRFLERSLQLCHLLRTTATVRRGIDVDREVLNAVLASSESSVTHRRRYRGYVRPANVLELLLLDKENPRSLAFSLADLKRHLSALPASTGSSRPERLLDDLIATVESADIAALVAIGGSGRPNLEAFLDHVLYGLERLAEAIGEVHFASGPAPRPLNAMARSARPVA